MTEIPEHLLQRSKARRSAMGLGGDEAAAPTPAKAEAAAAPAEAKAAATPAPAAAAPAPAPAAPTPPWVEAAERRRRIPFWAVPVLAMLPVWAWVYALTLDPPTEEAAGPLALGAEVYTGKCASCHGGAGGGMGSIPALAGSNPVTEAFEDPVEMVEWVMLGSDGYRKLGRATRGTAEHPVVGGMPGFGASLTPGELLAVVRHERETFNGETFEIEKWEGLAELGEQYDSDYPGYADGFAAALEAWESDPNTPVE